MGADERAQRGLFLAFQYPHAIPGVPVTSFLRSAINAVRKARNGGATTRSRSPSFARSSSPRWTPEGEPRARVAVPQRRLLGRREERVEILQMAMLKPRIAVLDETDSGLDIDALRVVASGVKSSSARRWARS